MILRIGGVVFATLAAYYLSAAVALKYFLSEIVFLDVPPSETQESRAFVVKSDGVEVVIREYASDKGSKCALYFPGQHGGIARYEREVFRPAVDRGVTVYAVSYPGYEGAGGKATFENVKTSTRSAIEHIDRETSCNITQSVFVGRSLGSAVAVENALIFKPAGLLLDSVSPSLGPVVKQKMKSSAFLWPAQLLPVNRLLEYDVNLKDALGTLKQTSVVIFQGELDKLATLENVQEAVIGQPNVELIAVNGASHSNTVSKAGELYFLKLCQLLQCGA